jgi:hypothetical protein
VRSTNVYEQRSLGLYPEDVREEDAGEPKSVVSYVGWQYVL